VIFCQVGGKIPPVTFLKPQDFVLTV
jgi:hypothetical protein